MRLQDIQPDILFESMDWATEKWAKKEHDYAIGLFKHHKSQMAKPNKILVTIFGKDKSRGNETLYDTVKDNFKIKDLKTMMAHPSIGYVTTLQYHKDTNILTHMIFKNNPLTTLYVLNHDLKTNKTDVYSP